MGPPFFPPRWAFGPYRWRDNQANPKKTFDGTPNRRPFNTLAVEDILMMEALGIPCTVYWADRPRGLGSRGYGSFRFDEKRLPPPERMIRRSGSKGIPFLLRLGPWVGDEALKEAKKEVPPPQGAGPRKFGGPGGLHR